LRKKIAQNRQISASPKGLKNSGKILCAYIIKKFRSSRLRELSNRFMPYPKRRCIERILEISVSFYTWF